MYDGLVGINRRLVVVALIAFIVSNLFSAYLFVDARLHDRARERDRAALTESRFQADRRGCLRDQSTAKAIRNILATAQESARRDGRLSVRAALYYRDAIESIKVPTCTREALGYNP